jgi:hypothetical protein
MININIELPMWRSSMHKVKPVTNAFNFSAQSLNLAESAGLLPSEGFWFARGFRTLSYTAKASEDGIEAWKYIS